VRFRSIAVIGVGLIGGSFAAAAKRLDNPPTVVGIDIDKRALSWACDHGVIDTASLPDGLGTQAWLGEEGVDLVVLATPAARAEEWLLRLGSMGYRGVVTDVASTKKGIVDAAERYLRSGASFVGGHPMAGSERSGVEASDPNLFEGAYYVLTPTERTDMAAFRGVHALVSQFGCRVVSVDAHAHDDVVAIVSHVPHVAASALVNLVAHHAIGRSDTLRLAAGGFKDTTRVAAGSPELWTGICLDNAPAVISGIGEFCDQLERFTTALQAGDVEATRAWLAEAADIRRSLPAQWVPATAQLTEVAVPVLDRPGVVAEVTMAAGRHGCNIEGIEIDHRSEASADLLLVLTDEGDIDAFVAELVEIGYSPRVGAIDIRKEG